MNKLDNLIERFSKKIEIVVGFPKDKQVIYPPDDRKGHHNKGGQTVSEVARWNEEGTKTKKGTVHIPARPFLKTTALRNKDRIKKMIADAFKPKNLEDEKYFDKIGMEMVNMVRQTIRIGPWAPNARTTKFQKLTHKEKKSFHGLNIRTQELILSKTRPLIDRGIMIKNVNYEIRRS